MASALAGWLAIELERIEEEVNDLARLPLALSLSFSSLRLFTSPLSAVLRVGVTSPLFYLASTLDVTTSTLSTPQLIDVKDSMDDALVRSGSRSTSALPVRSCIFGLGIYGRPTRILRCRGHTAVHWRSHRTLSFSVRAVVDAFEQSR
uniref:FGENESH: predicted gene_5.284 protein n=1 Tax=Rhodotorula toruloides TaxID=5286 RepID=A0A0K3CDA5_RHOTO